MLSHLKCLPLGTAMPGFCPDRFRQQHRPKQPCRPHMIEIEEESPITRELKVHCFWTASIAERLLLRWP